MRGINTYYKQVVSLIAYLFGDLRKKFFTIFLYRRDNVYPYKQIHKQELSKKLGFGYVSEYIFYIGKNDFVTIAY